MTQRPGSDDPYHHDPDAPRPEQPQGYQAAPGYGAAPGYDGGAPGQPVAKPGSVGLAEKLTYGGGVVSLITGIAGFLESDESVRERLEAVLEATGRTASSEVIDAQVAVAGPSALASGVVVALIWFLVGWLLGKGKGWARIVATVLAVINVATTLFSLFGSSLLPGATGGFAIVLSVISAALAAVIVFLLWKKESSAYFQATP